MLWQNFFTQTILIRGRDYYNRGKVIGLQCFGNKYTAKVLGSRPYSVTVEEKDGTFYIARCDCPHSRSGFYCKHIAAVLFAVDEYAHSHSDREVEKNPFDELYSPNGDDGIYRYFDMRRMTRGRPRACSVFSPCTTMPCSIKAPTARVTVVLSHPILRAISTRDSPSVCRRTSSTAWRLVLLMSFSLSIFSFMIIIR